MKRHIEPITQARQSSKERSVIRVSRVHATLRATDWQYLKARRPDVLLGMVIAVQANRLPRSVFQGVISDEELGNSLEDLEFA